MSLLRRIGVPLVTGPGLAGVMDYQAHGGDYSRESIDKNRMIDFGWNSLFGGLIGKGLNTPGAEGRDLAFKSLLMAPMKELVRHGTHSLNEADSTMVSLRKSLDEQAKANTGYGKYVMPAAIGGVGLLGALALARLASGVNRAADSKEGGRVQMRLPQRARGDTEATIDIPVSEANLSPSLLRQIGVDTRRKLRGEVRSRINRRDEEEEDFYKAAAITVEFIKYAASITGSQPKAVAGGFMPIEQPKAQSGTKSIETGEDVKDANGNVLSDPVDIGKQQQQQAKSQELKSQNDQFEQQRAQQDYELKREGIKLQHAKLQADIAAAGKPDVTTAVTPQVVSEPFDHIGSGLKQLGKRIEGIKSANVFTDGLDKFKQWDSAPLASGAGAASLGLSLAPGIGNVMSAGRAVNHFRAGNWGQGLMHSAFSIPFFGNALSGLAKGGQVGARMLSRGLSRSGSALAPGARGFASFLGGASRFAGSPIKRNLATEGVEGLPYGASPTAPMTPTTAAPIPGVLQQPRPSPQQLTDKNFDMQRTQQRDYVAPSQMGLVKSAIVFTDGLDKFKQWDDNAFDSVGSGAINLGASILPGVGNVMSGARSINAFRDGNWGQGLMHAGMAIPLFGNIASGIFRSGRAGTRVLAQNMAKSTSKIVPKLTPIVKGVGDGLGVASRFAKSPFKQQIAAGLLRSNGDEPSQPIATPQPEQQPLQDNGIAQNDNWRDMFKYSKTAAWEPEPYFTSAPGDLTGALDSPIGKNLVGQMGQRAAMGAINHFGFAAKTPMKGQFDDEIAAHETPWGKTLKGFLQSPIISSLLTDKANANLPRYGDSFAEPGGLQEQQEAASIPESDSRLLELLGAYQTAGGNNPFSQ